MSKTQLRTACFYLTQEEVKRLDEIRGFIPRSKMGAIAVRRLIEDFENGKLELLPTTTKASGVAPNNKS